MITFYEVFNYLMIFFENENYFKGHIIKEVFVTSCYSTYVYVVLI